jgi:CO/xanthine dehydrogenase Mo-binding subunit
MFFALESHTDLIAREVGMDPAEFRLKNFLGEGEEDSIGKRLRSVRFREVLQAALDGAGWAKRKRRPGYGRGIGLFGRHIGGGDTGVTLTAEPNGTFTVISPTFDQGAGTHTILRQLVAEEMGVAVQQVRVVVGDTDSARRDSGARASRVTYVAGRAVVRACEEMRSQLAAQAARILECRPEGVEFRNTHFRRRQDPSQQISLRKVVAQAGHCPSVTIDEDSPYPDDVTYFCAQVAEVEVDPETGKVKLHRFVTAHDVGTVINPITHQGQIDGGVIMGLGQALMEELVMQGGQITNASLGDYKLPTADDIPELKTVLVRSDGGLAPFQGKAIGEFANNSPPVAVANAVDDAVGVRISEIPITAEKIYRALKEKNR